jgi:hypothetical protein
VPRDENTPRARINAASAAAWRRNVDVFRQMNRIAGSSFRGKPAHESAASAALDNFVDPRVN